MTSLPALFLIGFTYSLYHCVGMCGGFVAAYSATCSIRPRSSSATDTKAIAGARPATDLRRAPNPGRAVLEQWPIHLLFNLGRVVSYTLIGTAFGFAGSWANYYGRLAGTRLQGIAGVVGGVLMILFAISLAGFLRLPAGALIGGSRVRRLFNTLLRSRSPWRTLPMGMLVGTVPCGLVYSMSSYALASGSPIRGAMAMAAFGFGTIPAMFSFGFISTALSTRVRKGMLAIAVVLTLLMGVEAIRRGWGAL